MLTDADMSRITSRVARGYGALVVGTFGSYAVGRSREGSDLDLFVIKQTLQRPLARSAIVRGHLVDVLHPLDIHVFTPAEFEECVYEQYSFTWTIAKQARIYHWSAESSSLVPSLRSRVVQQLAAF
jgi:predicted nucleotidyltransferase